MTRMPTYYSPHGGGPCFFMDTPPGIPTDTWDSMAEFLRNLPSDLPEPPKAIVVISAHWMTDVPTMITSEAPPLLYDYYGFPEHTYKLTYPAPGAPKLAERVSGLLNEAGFETASETKRGLDHGVFIPFKVIYPDADIPILQLSMLKTEDAAEHIRMGKALAPLRDEGILIVGSGLSYHNLRHFFHQPLAHDQTSKAFDDWLTDASTADVDREAKMSKWQAAPGARACHPTSEHLLPVFIAAGAAKGETGSQVFSDWVLGKAVSGYRFG